MPQLYISVTSVTQIYARDFQPGVRTRTFRGNQKKKKLNNGRKIPFLGYLFTNFIKMNCFYTTYK